MGVLEGGIAPRTLAFLQFSFLVAMFILICWPYLAKRSRFYVIGAYSNAPALRPLNDILLSTSSIYLFAGSYAAYCNQPYLALLCTITSFSSICYHNFREGKCFNFDNIFATSLLIIYVISLFQSFGINDFHFYFGLFGMPVAIFLLAYCGMPAEVKGGGESNGSCCSRSSRLHYDLIHSCWHVASGIGLIATVFFYTNLDSGAAPSDSSGASDIGQVMGSSLTLDGFCLPLVPSIAIITAIAINIVGNITGAMPLN